MRLRKLLSPTLGTGLLLGALAGCNFDNTPTQVTGRALHADGKAFGSTQVVVAAEKLADGGSPGESSYYPELDVFFPERKENTLDDGRFSIDLKMGDGFGIGVWSASVPASEGEVGPTFYFRPYASVAMTDVNAWIPKISTAPGADGGTQVTINAPPTVEIVPIKHASYSPVSQGQVIYRFQLLSQGQLLWMDWSLTGPTFTYPAEALEDRDDVQVRVTTVSTAMTKDQGSFLGINQPYQQAYDVSFDTLLKSPEQGHLTPVSRGVPCTGLNPAPAVCPLTDGVIDNDPWWDKSLGLTADNPDVTFSLRAPATLRTVVLRRAVLTSVPVTVEGSSDGTTWKPLGTVADGSKTQNPDGGTTPLQDALFASWFGMDALQRHDDFGDSIGFVNIPLDTTQGPVTQVRLHFTDPGPNASDTISEVSFFE